MDTSQNSPLQPLQQAITAVRDFYPSCSYYSIVYISGNSLRFQSTYFAQFRSTMLERLILHTYVLIKVRAGRVYRHSRISESLSMKCTLIRIFLVFTDKNDVYHVRKISININVFFKLRGIPTSNFLASAILQI